VLPTCLADTGNHAVVRQLAEADTANAELAIHRPRPAASLQRELRRVENFGVSFAFAILDLLAIRRLSG
jgi:hypothetical protein